MLWRPPGSTFGLSSQAANGLLFCEQFPQRILSLVAEDRSVTILDADPSVLWITLF